MCISYEPLREYLNKKGLSPNKLYKEGIITTNVATKINNDLPMNMSNLAKICIYLDIPIEQAVCITKENEA